METKTFPAKVEVLSKVISFVEENLEKYNCPIKIQTAMCVALEEVFVNIANYAYLGKDGNVVININYELENKTIIFQIIDNGVQFNPLNKPEPNISLSVDEREIGGLGIFITKKTMDVVSYTYENDKNILTLIKKI